MSAIPSRTLLGAAVVLAGAFHATGTTAPVKLSDQVVQVAQRHVVDMAEAEGLLAPQVHATVVGTLVEPGCGAPWTISPADTRLLSRMRFTARCSVARPISVDVVVRATLSAEVLVARVAIPAGKAIEETDLASERRDVANAHDASSVAGDAVGLVSRRAILPGQTVARSWLTQPLLVKRGEAVRIVARRGPLQVEASGEALEPGRRHETIRVRNTASGKVIQARVTQAATVEPVQFAPEDGE